jgi:Cellulase (glycosyl hydrolase family 5)
MMELFISRSLLTIQLPADRCPLLDYHFSYNMAFLLRSHALLQGGITQGKGRLLPLRLTIVVLLLCSAAAISMVQSTTRARAAVSNLITGLHVVGNSIETRYNTALTYHGVNRSGAEYQCTRSAGSTFDGPSDQASINAMLTWKINIVRVPLNEDCWLGINGEPTGGTTAAEYQSNISTFVNLLVKNNLAVILDLHWNAPGTNKALDQEPMPDLDHAPAFWASVANTFNGDASVMFDLYNEPHPASWSCWRNGSTAASTSPCTDVSFAVAGMQKLVTTVRNTGASNIILLSGLDYAGDLSGWPQYKPTDPDNNLAASLHIYNSSACKDTKCLDSKVAPVKAKYPVLATEMGENDCAHGFIDGIMPWFDSHSIGYLGWAWDTYDCRTFPSLISNYDGTPTAYGLGLKDHLSSL